MNYYNSFKSNLIFTEKKVSCKWNFINLIIAIFIVANSSLCLKGGDFLRDVECGLCDAIRQTFKGMMNFTFE